MRASIVSVLVGGLLLAGVGLRLGGLALGWTSGAAPPRGSAMVELTYAGTGPHAVGMQVLSIPGDAPMNAILWYPAKAGATSASARYVVGLKAFGDPPFALATYAGYGVRDAPADRGAGPYPLVLLSPGFAFGAGTYGWLAEHLASQGFAVLAMEHDEVLDPAALWRATLDRPRDTAATLDHAERAVRDGEWAGLVDTGRVAVVGHSYGGYTAIAAAGARFDGARLRQICDEVPADDPIVFQCDALVPHIGDIAGAVEADDGGTRAGPSWGDDRVDAAIALAGDAVMFGQAGLAEVSVPLMTIGGTADVDAPYAWGTRLAYEASSSTRKVEIGLEGAAHLVFTGPCEMRRRALGMVPEPFCADPAWDRADAHALVRHFTTAFLLAELRDDRAAARELASPAARSRSVRHASTGY